MCTKVVHIIIGLEVGGAELMLQRLLMYSKQSDESEHIVISLTDEGVVGHYLTSQGFKVHSLGMSSISSVFKTFLKLRVLLRQIKPDCVQTWMYHADFLGGLAAKSLNVKNIVWGIRTTNVAEGNSELTKILSRVCARLSYNVPHKIICAGRVSRDYHIKIGYDASKMLVIHNGYFFEDLIVSKEEGARIRKNNNLLPTDIVIGSVGRFHPVKNQKIFVKMAAELIKDYPQLKFLLIGRGNTPQNEELTTWLYDNKLYNNFRLLGQRSDIPQCFAAMDIFCLHSKTEGFPNALVEAMAAGVPCISTDVGDAKYIMSNLGTIVPQEDLEALIVATKELITKIPIEEKKKSLLKEHIYNKYNISSIYKEYAAVWNNTL